MIGFFSQNYMLLVLASFINNTTVVYDDDYKWLTYNNGVSLIILVSVFVVPATLLILTFVYFNDFKDHTSSTSKKWGFHMINIRMQRDLKNETSVSKYALNYHKLSKPMAIICGFWDYPRQLILCATLVHLRDTPWL